MISEFKIELKNDKPSLKNVLLPILACVTITSIGTLAWNNKLMISNINPKDLIKPQKIENQNSFQGRVNIMRNRNNELNMLPNNCGTRSVDMALRLIEDPQNGIDRKRFTEFQEKDVGVFGMSPGMMQIFLNKLKDTGVESTGYDISALSQEEVLAFLKNNIKQKKVPVVFINSELGLHWISVNGVDKGDNDKEEYVESIEDLENKITGEVIRGAYVRMPISEFYSRVNLQGSPIPGLKPTAFTISLKNKLNFEL